jgi:hypothetical protein
MTKSSKPTVIIGAESDTDEVIQDKDINPFVDVANSFMFFVFIVLVITLSVVIVIYIFSLNILLVYKWSMITGVLIIDILLIRLMSASHNNAVISIKLQMNNIVEFTTRVDSVKINIDEIKKMDYYFGYLKIATDIENLYMKILWYPSYHEILNTIINKSNAKLGLIFRFVIFHDLMRRNLEKYLLQIRTDEFLD